MLTKHVGRRGYGWIITKEARKVIGLDGWSNTGFTSNLTYCPNEDLTIVILGIIVKNVCYSCMYVIVFQYFIEILMKLV